MSAFEVRYDTVSEADRLLVRASTRGEAEQTAQEAEQAGFWNIRVNEVNK